MLKKLSVTAVILAMSGHASGADCIRGAVSRRTGTGGFVTIDGKLYHVSKNGYAIDRYAKGLHEIDGGMYYVKEDGSFLTNSAVEYLTFDANGRYTSGNATLDSYVDQALAACTNSGMTKAQKLRAAYLYVRDHGAYLARPHQARGTTAWAEESALFMFEHKRATATALQASSFIWPGGWATMPM